MQYLRAYQFAFDHPGWGSNLWCGALCHAIPVIGPFVFLGYQLEIIEQTVRDPQSESPRFNFKNFSSYLNRGAFPLLTWSVLSMVLLPLMYLVLNLVIIGGVVIAAGSDLTAVGAIASVIIGILFLFFYIGLAMVSLCLLPPTLGAGLSQDLNTGFKMAFGTDFIRRMWREMVLQHLFFSVSALAIVAIGAMVLLVGIFPALALVTVAQGHLYRQLYLLYLERGGTPVQLRGQVPPPRPVWVGLPGSEG